MTPAKTEETATKLAVSGEPDRDCPLCPRLADFRAESRRVEPLWFNAPVPTFGSLDARLLVVGLAPGLRGANRTGRPFTGDYAGDLLYGTLTEFGFAVGTYDRRPDDGLSLADCALTNAVRCVPPQNKPLPVEIRTCRTFLKRVICDMSRLVAVVALGRIAHESLARAFDLRLAVLPFAHGRQHSIARPGHETITLFDSYHCSRYNTNTGVLTEAMFRDIFSRARRRLDAAS